MNESDNLSNEVNIESDNVNSETNNSSSENEIIHDVKQSETSDVPSEQSEPGTSDRELSDEQIEEELEEEETPTSTVIQVVHDESEAGYHIDELDVHALNEFVGKQNELLSVSPTSNDYYTFIDGNILEYFADYMANYPLNDYKAVHLRHYVGSSSYQTQYDDYYYLWYDYPSTQALEIHKPYNVSQYSVSVVTQNDLSASIVYGSAQGQADIRKGVSYVQETAILCCFGCILVLYILHAIFKHLVR